LVDNLRFVIHVSGSSRGGGMKVTDPPEDAEQALAHASARDLDIKKESFELNWEQYGFWISKGGLTQNTARDWVSLV